MNELANAIAAEKDALLFELFKKHGYNRAKVIKLFRKKRITLLVQSNIESYCLDGKVLFRIEKIVHMDDENCKVTFTFKEVTDIEKRKCKNVL